MRALLLVLTLLIHAFAIGQHVSVANLHLASSIVLPDGTYRMTDERCDDYHTEVLKGFDTLFTFSNYGCYANLTRGKATHTALEDGFIGLGYELIHESDPEPSNLFQLFGRDDGPYILIKYFFADGGVAYVVTEATHTP